MDTDHEDTMLCFKQAGFWRRIAHGIAQQDWAAGAGREAEAYACLVRMRAELSEGAVRALMWLLR